MHGRKKGQVDSLPPLMHPNSAPGRMPNVDELRQVTVLSKSDWNRIQQQLNKTAMEKEKMRKVREQREELRERNKDRVQHWTNTISGQRQKKLEARRLREQKEEEERKQVDIEEAKFQAIKRKEAIEKAKTQQYYQTDRVKSFHGALLLTEVLKEREAQLELKRLQAQAVLGQDDHWVEQGKRDYEASVLKDQDEAAKRLAATRQHAEFQKLQAREHRRAYERELADDRAEGEEIKRLTAQYQMEKARLDEIRAAEAKQLMEDNLRQISDVKKMREINRQQEEDEDEECRIFAAAKRKMMKLRAEKEREMHQEKQKKLEEIREKLHAQIQQKMDNEDERITRAVEESDAKRAQEEAEKEERHRRAWESMGAHRNQQMKERDAAKEAQRRRDKEMMVVRKEADELFARNEFEKRSRKRAENVEIQNMHEAQMANRKRLAQEARAQDVAQDHHNQELIQVEEQQFQEYAQKVIDHCHKNGRNVYPLVRAAREGAGGGLGPVFPGKGGVRPSYMVADKSGVQLPNYQRDETNSTKELANGSSSQTNKRLGFVW